MCRKISNISTILHKEIIKIGPYRSEIEASWIIKMLEDGTYYKIHSGFSHGYTKRISETITTDGFSNWKNNYVHLSFDDMIKLFYMKGYQKLGDILITTPFDNQLIRNFNETHKLNNYKIEQPILQLKPMMIELVKKYPELK